MEQRCKNCRWAKPNNLIGWKLCTFPLPDIPKLPYWAIQIHHDSWSRLPVDVEDDDTDCPAWEAQP